MPPPIARWLVLPSYGNVCQDMCSSETSAAAYVCTSRSHTSSVIVTITTFHHPALQSRQRFLADDATSREPLAQTTALAPSKAAVHQVDKRMPICRLPWQWHDLKNGGPCIFFCPQITLQCTPGNIPDLQRNGACLTSCVHL